MILVGLHGGGRMTVFDDGRVNVESVTPQVLAYGLAHVTRFGGQAGPYSVGEHSVRMFEWARAEGQDKAVLRAILLHDAPECLGEGDTQRFVKRQFGAEGIARFAKTVTEALWSLHRPQDRASWSWEDCSVYHKYDEWIGTVEARKFGFPFFELPEWLSVPKCAVPDAGNPWPPELTIREYLQAWKETE